MVRIDSSRHILSIRGYLSFNFIQRSPLTSIIIRNASSKDTKPPVLEKPEKFNPPSHGARLRSPPHNYYGPQLTAEELAEQKVKKYPNMMPPEGTFLHWFIHNKLIHLWLSLGILASLAVTVMVTNFKHNSPFADMLPDWFSLFIHPIKFCRTVIEVIKLDTARTSAETAEKRKQRVDDVAKRAAFRKAHGLDKFEGIGGWTARTDAETLGPGMRTGDGSTVETNEEQKLPNEGRGKRPVKKWLGIW